MSQTRNRRLISGERVLARCSLELPKLDPFSSHKVERTGFMVLNVRGGSLYLANQFDGQGARRAFPSDAETVIRRFTLYPSEGSPILVGDVKVRYLKLTGGRRASGLVLRFANLTERQLDLLNTLPSVLPLVTGDEESAIPLDELRKL